MSLGSGIFVYNNYNNKKSKLHFKEKCEHMYNLYVCTYALEQELCNIFFGLFLGFYVKLYSHNQAHTESVHVEIFSDFHRTGTLSQSLTHPLPLECLFIKYSW